MSTPSGVFDESWFRVKDCRLRLMPGVELVRQQFKGEAWYVVCDKLGHQYFRVRPEAYNFIAHLEDASSVEEAWDHALELDPSQAPSQGDVVQLLSQLYRSGLLRGDRMSDIEALAQARKTEKNTRVRQQMASFLFLKIPVFNPDPFLRRTVHLVRWCFGSFGFFAVARGSDLGRSDRGLALERLQRCLRGLAGLVKSPVVVPRAPDYQDVARIWPRLRLPALWP